MNVLHDLGAILGPSGLSSGAGLPKAGCGCLAGSISRQPGNRDGKANDLEGTGLAPGGVCLCW